MRARYDLPGGQNRGELMTPVEDVRAMIRAGHKAGWQVGAHVAGDAGVDVLLDALRMMTIDAAYLSFDEKKRGSIEVGKLADLAILTDDFLQCPEEQIRRIKVTTTVVDGKVVFD